MYYDYGCKCSTHCLELSALVSEMSVEECTPFSLVLFSTTTASKLCKILMHNHTFHYHQFKKNFYWRSTKQKVKGADFFGSKASFCKSCNRLRETVSIATQPASELLNLSESVFCRSASLSVDASFTPPQLINYHTIRYSICQLVHYLQSASCWLLPAAFQYLNQHLLSFQHLDHLRTLPPTTACPPLLRPLNNEGGRLQYHTCSN